MNAARHGVLATLIAFSTINSARADQSFFMGLGDLPGGTFESYATDISGDGSVVVGFSSGAAGVDYAYRWTRDAGMTALGTAGAGQIVVSTDGSTVVGNTELNPNGVPFRWTQQSGALPLPLRVTGNLSAYANGVNGDGSVVVGGRQDVPAIAIPLRWTVAAGTQVILNSSNSIEAQDVSDDGSVILAVGSDSNNSNKYLWTEKTGLSPLPQPARGTWTYAQSISGNGKVVAGYSDLAGDPIVTSRVLRWSAETGTVELPPTPDGGVPFLLRGGISSDGSVIVGAAKGGLYATSSGNSLFIWDAVHGSRNLLDVLINEYGLGPSLAGWTIPSAPYFGVSGDGRTIYGVGLDPAGNQEGWIAHLGTVPEPSTFVLAGLGSAFLLASQLRRFRSRLTEVVMR